MNWTSEQLRIARRQMTDAVTIRELNHAYGRAVAAERRPLDARLNQRCYTIARAKLLAARAAAETIADRDGVVR